MNLFLDKILKFSQYLFSVSIERVWIFYAFISIKIYRPNIYYDCINIHPSLLIEGSPMYLKIKQKGCYKIGIKGFGMFSGKRRTIKIQTPSSGKLEVKFYGRKENFTKVLTFNIIKFKEIQVPNKVQVKPHLLQQRELIINLQRKNLVSGIKSFNSKVDPCLNENITINKSLDLKGINIKIDKSIIHNYEKSIL